MSEPSRTPLMALNDGIMLTSICEEVGANHILYPLGWRYTRPLVPTGSPEATMVTA